MLRLDSLYLLAVLTPFIAGLGWPLLAAEHLRDRWNWTRSVDDKCLSVWGDALEVCPLCVCYASFVCLKI